MPGRARPVEWALPHRPRRARLVEWALPPAPPTARLVEWPLPRPVSPPPSPLTSCVHRPATVTPCDSSSLGSLDSDQRAEVPGGAHMDDTKMSESLRQEGRRVGRTIGRSQPRPGAFAATAGDDAGPCTCEC